MSMQNALNTSVTSNSKKGPVFPAYLECEVGGKSPVELIQEIQANGMFVSGWTEDIMSQPGWKQGERETVCFARVIIRDLGFTKNPTTAQVWARILELGHSLCEPADGPAIRLALGDQSRNDEFWLAMRQIGGSDGGLGIFSVVRFDGGGQWLDTDWVGPDDEWDLEDVIVFRLRK
jgi:hypothetical protein